MKRKIKKVKDSIAEVLLKRKVIKKANLFIIGAQKCGTSTLFDNLIKHNDIYGGKIKEKNFFSHTDHFKKGYNWYHDMYPRISVFKKLPKTRYFLDASPSYLSHEHAADNILKYNPKAKFIVMMRNPVDRAFSAWNMYRQMNLLNEEEKMVLFENHIKGSSDEREKQFKVLLNKNIFPSFEEMVEEELKDFSNDSNKIPGILARGIYSTQIEYYFSLFKFNQFFFICTEEFKVNKTNILSELMLFLELDNNLSNEKLVDTHIREYEQKMSQEVRTKLLSFYAPHNKKLYDLVNKRFNWEN